MRKMQLLDIVSSCSRVLQKAQIPAKVKTSPCAVQPLSFTTSVDVLLVLAQYDLSEEKKSAIIRQLTKASQQLTTACQNGYRTTLQQLSGDLNTSMAENLRRTYEMRYSQQMQSLLSRTIETLQRSRAKWEAISSPVAAPPSPCTDSRPTKKLRNCPRSDSLFNEEQTSILEAQFAISQYAKGNVKTSLAAKLGVEPVQIMNWVSAGLLFRDFADVEQFQNRRSRSGITKKAKRSVSGSSASTRSDRSVSPCPSLSSSVSSSSSTSSPLPEPMQVLQEPVNHHMLQDPFAPKFDIDNLLSQPIFPLSAQPQQIAQPQQLQPTQMSETPIFNPSLLFDLFPQQNSQPTYEVAPAQPLSSDNLDELLRSFAPLPEQQVTPEYFDFSGLAELDNEHLTSLLK